MSEMRDQRIGIDFLYRHYNQLPGIIADTDYGEDPIISREVISRMSKFDQIGAYLDWLDRTHPFYRPNDQSPDAAESLLAARMLACGKFIIANTEVSRDKVANKFLVNNLYNNRTVFEVDLNKKIREIESTQIASLLTWVDYLNNSDKQLPTWFKYFAIRSVTKLAEYDPFKQSFPKRNSSTISAFPSLQPESVDNLFADITTSDQNRSVSFKELYLQQLQSLGYFLPSSDKLGDGHWQIYSRSDDYIDVIQLVCDIAGTETGWCIQNQIDALRYLKDGDLHVLFSERAEGIGRLPRVAVYYQNGRIADIAGRVNSVGQSSSAINDKQDIEFDLIGSVVRRLVEVDFIGNLDCSMTQADFQVRDDLTLGDQVIRELWLNIHGRVAYNGRVKNNLGIIRDGLFERNKVRLGQVIFDNLQKKVSGLYDEITEGSLNYRLLRGYVSGLGMFSRKAPRLFEVSKQQFEDIALSSLQPYNRPEFLDYMAEKCHSERVQYEPAIRLPFGIKFRQLLDIGKQGYAVDYSIDNNGFLLGRNVVAEKHTGQGLFSVVLVSDNFIKTKNQEDGGIYRGIKEPNSIYEQNAPLTSTPPTLYELLQVASRYRQENKVPITGLYILNNFNANKDRVIRQIASYENGGFTLRSARTDTPVNWVETIRS